MINLFLKNYYVSFQKCVHGTTVMRIVFGTPMCVAFCPSLLRWKSSMVGLFARLIKMGYAKKSHKKRIPGMIDQNGKENKMSEITGEESGFIQMELLRKDFLMPLWIH